MTLSPHNPNTLLDANILLGTGGVSAEGYKMTLSPHNPNTLLDANILLGTGGVFT
jgi:arginine exporter protein ArgO